MVQYLLIDCLHMDKRTKGGSGEGDLVRVVAKTEQRELE